MNRYYKADSRLDYSRDVSSNESLSLQELQLGCSQRIADATEAMAKNYTQLQSDLNYYKAEAERQKICNLRAYRRISALKGVITKLRRAGK